MIAPYRKVEQCLNCCNVYYNSSMRLIETIKVLNDISCSQKGLFTTTQAKSVGVERYALSRLEKAGNIERLAQGIYRMGGAPSSRIEDVLAVWLSLDPGRAPGSRPESNSPVAMGATAAWLLELGEIGPATYEFCCATRRQTQRSNVILRIKDIDARSVGTVGGIPITPPELIITDLIDNGEDLSLVGNVLGDALTRRLVKDEVRLAHQVNKRAAKAGVLRGDSLYKTILEGAVL